MVRKVPTLQREAAVQAYLERKDLGVGTSYAEVAAEFGVSVASLDRWLRLYRSEGHVEPRKPIRSGFAPMFSDADMDVLKEWVLEHPTARLWEVVEFVSNEMKIPASEPTVRRALAARGISKRHLKRAQADNTEPRSRQTFRYNERHRRKPESKPHRRSYPSDFTESEWAAVEPMWSTMAVAKPTSHSVRDVLEAIRHILATGCPWRYLPHDFPPHTTTRRWFDTWNRDGTLARVNDAIRRLLRRRSAREETPSVIIVDSQSVKCREGGEQRGYDGGKKIAGRKRHVAVDTEGFVWNLEVHSSSVQDRDGIDLLLPDNITTALPRLARILVDAGYQGRAEQRTTARTGVPVEVIRRRGDTTNGEWSSKDAPSPAYKEGFRVLPKRWIVERSFAWCNRRRRLSVDYERKADVAKAWVLYAIQHIMVARMSL